MEKYQLVKAESFHKDFIIKLNSENMPAVGRLDEKSFGRFLEHSDYFKLCLLYTSPSPRDLSTSRMPSSA